MATRYHPLVVALHWLLAAMILGALFMGSTRLATMPNADPHKLAALSAHMTVGIGVGILMILRLVFRLITPKPPKAHSGVRAFDIAAHATHWLLYLLVFAMVASGMAISIMAGLSEVVFGGIGTLPADFSAYPPRAVHGIVSKLLMALVLLHVAGWLYHALFVKDRLLARMWFGKD